MPEGGAGWEGGQTYVVYASHPDSGYLKHVYNVLERAGQSQNIVLPVRHTISTITFY